MRLERGLKMNNFTKELNTNYIFVETWGGLGDCLLTTPAIESLKKNNPSKLICISCVHEAHKAILLNNPYIDRFFDHEVAQSTGEVIKWKIPNYGDVLPSLSVMQPASQVICDLLKTPYDTTNLRIFLTDREIEEAERLVSEIETPIAISCTSRCSQNRDWGLDRWVEVINGFKTHTFIQLGTLDEQRIPKTVDARFLSLRQQMALLSKCHAFSGMDSFFSHCTNAFGLTGVVLFGDSSPVVWGHPNNINLYKELRCSPCIDILQGYECPYGLPCLNTITPNEVIEALKSALEKNKNRTLNETVQLGQSKKITNKKFDKVISYSLFTPKKLYSHRVWDKTNNPDRYWYNIPILMAINKIIYTDFDILIQVSPDIKQDIKYEMLKKLSEEFGIKIEVNNSPYNETEPTVWRYRPLFNKECNVLLCRDIDSLPTYNEYLATKDFIISDKNLHTIRSHTNHTTGATIILAGLCGFKPNNIPFLNFDFDKYYNTVSKIGWGLDQSSLIQIFDRPDWTKSNFIDSALSNRSHKVGNPIRPCIKKTEKDYKSTNEYSDIFNIISQYVEWAGEPVDFRKEKLLKLLDMDYLEFKKLKEILENSNERIKEFYLGTTL